MPDLIQMLHGNTCGIKRLVREFRMFWIQKHDKPDQPSTEKLDSSTLNNSAAEADLSILNESAVDCSLACEDKDSPDKLGDKEAGGAQQKREEGYGCSISKTQLDKKIRSMAVREKREGTIRACWYVNKDVLSQFNLTDISLPNSWVHLSAGSIAPLYPAPKSDSLDTLGEEEKAKTITKPNDQKSIIGFTLTKEDLLKQEALKPKVVETEKQKIQSKTVNDQKSIIAFTKNKIELTELKQKSVPEEESEPTVKTPAKPKMSVMDMLMKKSSCKKKNLVRDNKETSKEDDRDSDIEILESPLEIESGRSVTDVKKSNETPVCDGKVTTAPEVESMDVDDSQSAEKSTVSSETQMDVSVSDTIAKIVAQSEKSAPSTESRESTTVYTIPDGEESNDVIMLD